MLKLSLAAGVTLAMLGGAAMAQDMTNSVDVSNAKIDGNKITGITATIDKPGFIAIHNDDAGAPPNSLGHTALKKGENDDVTVKADGALNPDSDITLMLHYDTNNNGTYDFGPGSTDVDTPAKADGKVVNVPLKGSKM